MTAIAYIVHSGDTIELRVIDAERKSYSFPLDIAGLARLQAECAAPLCTLIQRWGRDNPMSTH
jgi:hypothetical protein